MPILLPHTVNFHIVRYCNYACAFCYDHFNDAKSHRSLSIENSKQILQMLKEDGARKITFAGGEPTLHRNLLELLQYTCSIALVSSLVTHGRGIDEKWIKLHCPWLRWLALSCDSISDEVSDELGRRLKNKPGGHIEHVRQVCTWLHKWNSIRPPERRVRQKINMVITSLNAHEDPTEFLRVCCPEKVKLLQMLPVEGENDKARHLICPDNQFRDYVDRVRRGLAKEDIEIVPETNEDMDDSYAMVDPLGRFFQQKDGRYISSRPILEVGVRDAFAEVGGYQLARFVGRGGQYDPGPIADGNRPYWIAIEGLDGCGKSTIVRLLAEQLEAILVKCPPDSMQKQRLTADQLPESERREWYRQANREAADEAAQHQAAGRPVIIDRSPASTAAYGAAWADQVARSEEWPESLLRPDEIFFLDVPEEERCERLAARGKPETSEETRLREDGDFRSRVLAGYNAFGVRHIAADKSPDEIVAEILAIVKSGGRDRGSMKAA